MDLPPDENMLDNVEYLSPAAKVAMADEWYDYSTPDHFWIKWRIQAMMRYSGYLPALGSTVLEVGCGHGVFRDQLERQLNYTVDACDLNEAGLAKANKGRGRLLVYDIFDQHADLRGKYEAVFLMDVIEHIEHETLFLNACRYHTKSNGILVLNVPALNSLYSKYDAAAGHVRRYNKKMISTLFIEAGIEPVAVSYWGFPMLPLLFLRKYYLKFVSDENIIESGFAPPTRFAHYILQTCRIAETISPISPLLGTSLMAVGRFKT
jgi:2-polyprenyl-3-methyl-5-hydroxy-6-metoxy-1,4-benzoquinol methylase